MKKLLSITLHSSLLLLTFSLFAGEIHSPYAMNFYAAPEWLPETVDAEHTPGSDSTIEVQCWTNRIITAWELAPDSVVSQRLGSGDMRVWNDAFPVWANDTWSIPDAIINRSPWHISMELRNQRLDEQTESLSDEYAEDLKYHMNADAYIKFSGQFYRNTDWLVHFTRTVSNDVHAITNTIKRRITFDTESSFYHTLDGWCEREYYTGLGHDEPDHDLETAPLQTIGTNRAVVTQRITGKTNQWAVADRMLAISRNDWRAGFDVDNTPYIDRQCPYWSSQAFDKIYGPQIPDDIYWTSDGLYALSRRCAVLRGVTNEVVWSGSGTNGWFYTEMFPDDFCYGLTNRYPLPVTPPGHEFGFPKVVAADFDHVTVDSVTGKTLRIERKHQAAVNQAMTELDRTIHSVGRVESGMGMERHFGCHWRFWSPMYSLDELGFSYDSDRGAYRIPSTQWIYPTTSSNYWAISTNAWQVAPGLSDAIEISSNEVYCTIGTMVDCGSWEFSADDIIANLNEFRAIGTTGEVYYVYVRDVSYFRNRDSVSMYLACNIPGYGYLPNPVFPCPATNGYVTSGVQVGNVYHLREAGRPDFEYMDYLPMDQAWSGLSHSRVARCRDICTASICVERHPWDPSLVMHCSNLPRNRATPFTNVHSNEWTLHDFELRNRIGECVPIDWMDPKSYVDFSYRSVGDVLESIQIPGDQTVNVFWEPGEGVVHVQVDEDGVWSRVDVPGSATALRISAHCPGLMIVGDETRHSIPAHDPVEGYCRTRITNVIDWNFNSIRKKTNE